eukprot:IDg12165t1
MRPISVHPQCNIHITRAAKCPYPPIQLSNKTHQLISSPACASRTKQGYAHAPAWKSTVACHKHQQRRPSPQHFSPALRQHTVLPALLPQTRVTLAH